MAKKLNNKQRTYGTVSEGYFFRTFVGEGELDGKKFELAISASTCAPLVIFGKRAFLLTWEDVCDLAKVAGLFDTGK